MTGVHPGVLSPSEHRSPVRLFPARVRELDLDLLVLLAADRATLLESADPADRLHRVHHQWADDPLVFDADSRVIWLGIVHFLGASRSIQDRVADRKSVV